MAFNLYFKMIWIKYEMIKKKNYSGIYKGFLAILIYRFEMNRCKIISNKYHKCFSLNISPKLTLFYYLFNNSIKIIIKIIRVLEILLNEKHLLLWIVKFISNNYYSNP